MDAEALSPAEVAHLASAQVQGLVEDLERHGVELGTLLGALLTLIERHGLEAQALPLPPAAGPWAQLAADHETMQRFAAPLGTLRQFYDRCRQRLEHLEQALALLPAAAPSPADAKRAACLALFPLEEEQARLSVPSLPPPGPDVELF